MNILLLRSNPISPDPRVEKIGKTLISAGYRATVVAWDRTGELPSQENRDGLLIYRLPIRAQFGTGMGNFPQLMRWQWGLLRWLLQHKAEFELIHACDFDTILPAILMKAAYGKKVIYDIFDFYADHLRSTPVWIKRVIRQIDLWAIGRADALILADDSRIEQIRGSKPRSIAIIYNSPEDVWDKYIGSYLPSEGVLRLAYIGLLQVERGLMEILSILTQHPDWLLDLAGFGGDEKTILAAAEKLPNVKWYGRVSYQQALQLSANADVLFATYDPSIANHKYSSPNKIFEAMMLGKPIIVAYGTNMDRIIKEADCGCIVPYGNIPALEQTLQTLTADPGMVRRLGANARKAYERRYHWDLMSQQLVKLYKQVCG